MNTSNTKDTIYIDVDDDITGIIDKVRGSKDKIVALVLPKRATVLQSIVNMKLLKRSAGEAKKNLVLITSEAGVLPLAGAVGLHVAKTLQSKPTIPKPPTVADDDVETVEGDDETDSDEAVDNTKAIGELAGFPVAADDETIEVDDDPADEPGKQAGKKSKNKKLKVPNFESFRTRLFIGIGALLALILLWVLFSKILPKAKITITTDSSAVSANTDFTADAAAKTVDEAARILPATQKVFTKDDSEKLTATGQKDEGTKAIGSVTLKNCTHTAGSVDIPAGTNLTTGNFTFITQSGVTLPASAFNGIGTCISSTKDVDVQAQNAGDQYNISGGRTFSVKGYPDVSGVDSSAMTGGTSKIVKVVAQADLDAAKQKMFDRNNDPAKAELVKQMKAEKFFAINETFSTGNPTLTSTPKVGEVATDVTVNMTVGYTMLGVKQDDLAKIVEAEIRKHIDNDKLAILNNGLDTAQTTITDKKSDTNVKVALQINAEAGPQLDAAAIKQAVAGRKRGDTQSIIEARPGIKEVKIDYSPFWRGSTPTRISRITVIFIQPNGQPSKQ